jgi:DNA-binding NtrC family response regulator
VSDGESDEEYGLDVVTLLNPAGSESRRARRFQLTVLSGEDKNTKWQSSGALASIGSHRRNDLVLSEPTVSRFHCEIREDAGGPRVLDLDSSNGTLLDGVRIKDGFLKAGSLLRLGAAQLRFDFVGQEEVVLPLSEATRFGTLVGTSVAMRYTFALLERAAQEDVTVLLEGETGTGKGAAAEAIHKASARREGQLVVIDCSAIPANLLESELFGHEKGSFTGADARRIGAFEEASGGTLFLDEIGELPLEMQAKLLRAIENREIRRIGTNQFRPIDVRVIAATNRDLRGEVNAGQFRSDLYYRLAVVKITLPPLRERPDDIQALATQILGGFGAGRSLVTNLLTPEFLGNLQSASWPGNVRELRNYLERCKVFRTALPVGDIALADGAQRVDASLPYPEARRRALAAFEKDYLRELLKQHGGRVAQAAVAAGVDRVYLYRLLRRHGLKPDLE